MTTSAGYYLGSRPPFHFAGLVHTLLGTLLVASGTATLNQWMERRWDAQMRRTANRPLPSGRLKARNALLFGILLSISGGVYLNFLVNSFSSLLAVATLLSYLFVYTPLKRKTPLCTLLGAFPGAMPTLIGWAGASSVIDRNALCLFAILCLWQFPHFLSIGLMYRDDYEHAGYRMLPDFDQDTRFTRAEILTFTIAVVLVTMLSAHQGTAYLVAMLLAGIFLLYYSAKLAFSSSKASASGLLHASVVYLPVVLAIMIAAKA
jgi:protoheme IX farnesyltransferase